MTAKLELIGTSTQISLSMPPMRNCNDALQSMHGHAAGHHIEPGIGASAFPAQPASWGVSSLSHCF